MSIHYPDNTLNRSALSASGITDASTYLDVVSDGSEKRLSIEELKKTGVQVINVRQYGAVCNGIADDTSAIQLALNSASGKAVVLDGTSYVSDTITIPSSGIFIGNNNAKIITPNLWFNKAVISLSNNKSSLNNILIQESGASPRDASKSGNNNLAILVSGDDCYVANCECIGFMFGVAVRGGDRAIVEKCTISSAKAWGIEVDGSKDVRILKCTSHSNGWHGMKTQNEDVATSCDGLIVDQYLAYNNGQRTVPAGGSEVDNGVGISFYNGGYRYILSNSVCHNNYGSGFSQKGGGTAPIQGEGVITNCLFYDNLTGNDVVHGMEFGVGGGLGCYNIHVNNVICTGNTGDGFFIGGAVGLTINNCTSANNLNNGFTFYDAYDVKVNNCNILANREMGCRVGYSHSGSNVHRRISIKECTISGNWDYSLTVNPTGVATTEHTDYGIFIYSDTAFTEIDGCNIYNIAGTDQSLRTHGRNTTIKNTKVYHAVRSGIYIAASTSGVILDNCNVINTDFSSSTYYGSYYIGSNAEVTAINCRAECASTTSQSRVFLSAGTLRAKDTTYTNHTYMYINDGGNTYCEQIGTGSPESVLVASRGSRFYRTDGGAGTTLYIKESGTSNTGWAAK